MRKLLIFATTLIIGAASFVSLAATPAYAQVDTSDGIDVCDFIRPICNALGIDPSDTGGTNETAQRFVAARLQLFISLIFVGIIILAVFIIIRAGVKYIQSQGDEGKIQEAQKAIKSVFIGIAVLFVGILGIVLVLAFFGGVGLLSPGGTGDNNDGCRFENGILVCPSG